MQAMRVLVRSCMPAYAEERLSYGVPYFYGHSRICFIWPASVKGSGFKKGIRFGLCRGNELSNEQGIIEMAHRKEVGFIEFDSITGIEAAQDTLREILHEAVLVDEQRASKKKN